MPKHVFTLPQDLGPLEPHAHCLLDYVEQLRDGMSPRQKIVPMDAIGHLDNLRTKWPDSQRCKRATLYDVIAAIAWRKGLQVRVDKRHPYISLWSTFFVLTLGVPRPTANKWAHAYDKLLRTNTPAQQFDTAVAGAGGLDRYAYSSDVAAHQPAFQEPDESADRLMA